MLDPPRGLSLDSYRQSADPAIHATSIADAFYRSFLFHDQGRCFAAFSYDRLVTGTAGIIGEDGPLRRGRCHFYIPIGTV